MEGVVYTSWHGERVFRPSVSIGELPVCELYVEGFQSLSTKEIPDEYAQSWSLYKKSLVSHQQSLILTTSSPLSLQGPSPQSNTHHHDGQLPHPRHGPRRSHYPRKRRTHSCERSLHDRLARYTREGSWNLWSSIPGGHRSRAYERE
jgi:hypothetical protein